MSPQAEADGLPEPRRTRSAAVPSRKAFTINPIGSGLPSRPSREVSRTCVMAARQTSGG